jgi:ABC-type antimicrobial peptide transport system permease subunit
LLSAAVFLNLELKAEEGIALLLTVAAIMFIVGLVATLGPARRSLRMQPTGALRVDA